MRFITGFYIFLKVKKAVQGVSEEAKGLGFWGSE